MHAEILLPLYLNPTQPSLTYRVPQTLTESVKPGSAVRVPVRGRTYTGIVTELHERSVAFAVRDILGVQSDGEGMLETWQIELARSVARTTFTPMHAVLKLFLPQQSWKGPRAAPYERHYERTETPLPDRLGQKQRDVIERLEREGPLARNTLDTAPLKRLLELKLIRESRGGIQGTQHHQVANGGLKPLTPDQTAALKAIEATNDRPILLHGVTASGKTEIYLHLAKAASNQGKQTILLVPEIALTPQLIGYFTAVFGKRVAVMHSQLSLGEREREWWRIHRGEADVVIGSRSAIFSPARQLGLIVIDEEHEWSYKQDQSPHYHARNVAFTLAELTGAKLVLGSATPDVETRYACDTEKIRRVELTQRVNRDGGMPQVTLVDMREELKKKNFGIFSELLEERLRTTLAEKNQAILFLNRRGYTSSVVCRECGIALTCDHCDVSLTTHRATGTDDRLICHHCGFERRMPEVCPGCGGVSIKSIGLGTQRVEEELQKRFPTTRILRADRDTTTVKDSFKLMYDALKNNEADILIGTQMISKGLDLPRVTLVGVMMADIGLHIPDFRAGERAFQLLTQVAGRSGRAEDPGTVVIQTYNPDHPSLVAASTHDYAAFYNQEISNRKEHGYPPFSRLIKLTFRNEDQKKCSTEAKRVAELLKETASNHAIDAAPALISRLHNKYRWNITIQGDAPHEHLHRFLAEHPLPAGWSIDPDPVVMS